MDIQVIGNNATAVKWAGIITALLAAYYNVRFWLNKISRIMGPIIKDVEERAKDHIIDKADRKQIALNEVARLEADGTLKLDFVSRFIVSKIINKIAEGLPDFRFNDEPLPKS